MRPSFNTRAMRRVAGLALLGSLAVSCGNGTGSSDGASGADSGGVSATVKDFEIAISGNDPRIIERTRRRRRGSSSGCVVPA